VRLQPPHCEAQGSASGGNAGVDLCCSGWGLACLGRIARGEVIVRVPRSAAFTPKAELVATSSRPAAGGVCSASECLRAAKVPEEFIVFSADVDCQLPLAATLLWARSDDAWRPKLRPEVTPAVCLLPWACPHSGSSEGEEGPLSTALGGGEVATLLRGTELELPVRRKRRRLEREATTLQGAFPAQSGFLREYTDACAVIMSRIQPWWGGSLVPFVDQANHTWGTPHIEFQCKAGAVIGKATCDIFPGEVFQSYGNLSTADSLYRYGFSPPAAAASEIHPRRSDVVTVGVQQLQEAVAAASTSASGVEAAGRRLPLLLRAGLLEESPWDGVEDAIGVELSMLNNSVRGARRVLAAAALMLLPEAAWAKVEEAARDAKGAVGVAEKLLEAILPPAPVSSADGALAKRTKSAGAPNWARLLPPGVTWATSQARTAAIAAIRHRDGRYHGSSSLADDEAAFDACAAGSGPLLRGLTQLRIVERRILAAALRALGDAAGGAGCADQPLGRAPAE